MKTLLYFEEYVSKLSKKLDAREDVKVIKIRPLGSLKRNFTEEEIKESLTNDNIFIINNQSKEFDTEIDRLKNWLKEKNIVVEYFLNDSEYFLEYANKIARGLNLPALSEQQTEWVRDKVSMKQRFNEIGLNTVKYSTVNSKRDIINFYSSNNFKPIIFKPRKGMNSINVYKINDFDDIKKLSIDIEEGKYMVETFCDDHEWSIESLVQDGIVLDSFLTYIPNPTIWASISNDLNCHMTVPTTPDYFKFHPKSFIQKIVDGMELKNGFMTIEVFISEKGEVTPSELGWRLPGCQATTNHSLSYGIDIYNLLIDTAIGCKINLDYKKPLISVGDLYLPNKNGVVTKMTTLDELKKYPGFVDGEFFVTVGQKAKKRRVGDDSSGWVQIAGKNEKETLNIMKSIYDEFVIETEEEKKVKKYVKDN